MKSNRSRLSLLSSDRGQALVSAIMVSLGVMVMTGFLFQQSVQTEKSLRVPRVKSTMNGVEAKIRMASLQPQTFSCPATATATFNSSLCTMNTNFSELSEMIPGCHSPSNAGPCGVVVQNIVLNGTTLTADVVYQGDELPIAPLNLTFQIPTDVLQATDSNCASINPSRPVFAGYNADGSLKCLPLPADCPPGQYAASVNVNTLALNCAPLPTAANACAANQYMTGVTWNGGPTFTVNCSPRLNPFTYFSFTPTLVVKTTPYSSPTTPPANGVCTPTCTPGPVTDTGCTGVGTMGTTNGCVAGTRAEPSCVAATTTTTTTSTTTTTVAGCKPDGYATGVWSGADDALCTAQSFFTGFGPEPWGICCSGSHAAKYGPTDTIGSGKCQWECGATPPVPSGGTWVRTGYFADLGSHATAPSCSTGTLPSTCCPGDPGNLGAFLTLPPACPCNAAALGKSVTYGRNYNVYHETTWKCQ